MYTPDTNAASACRAIHAGKAGCTGHAGPLQSPSPGAAAPNPHMVCLSGHGTRSMPAPWHKCWPCLGGMQGSATRVRRSKGVGATEQQCCLCAKQTMLRVRRSRRPPATAQPCCPSSFALRGCQTYNMQGCRQVVHVLEWRAARCQACMGVMLYAQNAAVVRPAYLLMAGRSLSSGHSSRASTASSSFFLYLGTV